MSDNDIIISVGSNKLINLIGEVVKKSLSQHDHERLNGLGPNHLFTRREVADMFGLEYSSIRRMIERGTLQTTADCRYIPKISIDQYLNKKNCLGSAGEQPRPMPDPIVSSHDESCHHQESGTGIKPGISPRLIPGSIHAKDRSEGIEKNSKANTTYNLNETK